MDGLEKDLKISRDGESEIKTRLAAATEKVHVLQAYLVMQKTDFDRLTTELANAKNHNDELYKEMKTTRKDVSIAQEATQGSSKSVFAIESAVIKKTRQMDDTVQTAVETVRTPVDRIHNTSVPRPFSSFDDVTGTGEIDEWKTTESPYTDADRPGV